MPGGNSVNVPPMDAGLAAPGGRHGDLTLLQIDVHVHPEVAYNVLKSLRSILEKRIVDEPTAEDNQRLERLLRATTSTA